MQPISPQDQYEYLFQQIPPSFASFGERLMAAIIDWIVLVPVSLSLNILLGDTWRQSNFASNIGYFFVAWLYDALMESGNWQATVGKRVMRINVTGTSGERLSFGRASIRHFSKYLSCIILGVGYLMMLWDNRRQALHDKLADSFVLNN